MSKKSFHDITSVHFIGIGGIGMSALAQFFVAEGKNVSGSDLAFSKITDLLKEKGVEIFLEQDAKNIGKDVDLVVYTVAVLADNPELNEAKKRKIRTMTYPEALGLISKEKFTIAISGTHGKTTTTAMIAKVMIDAGLKPTVIAGSLMSEYKSNFVQGKSDYFVVEACEYKRSFLHLIPNILVITNIDEDHLDYYRNLEDIQSAFTELASRLKKHDFLICNIDAPNIESVIGSSRVECNIVDYHTLSGAKPKLQIPGKHNEENAEASLAVAIILGIKDKQAVQSLEDFTGTWRRLEKIGISKTRALIFDDYAHHPTEIKATLSSLFEMFPDKKIVVIFQPHLFSRTKIFLEEFGQSFGGAEEVILAPIYASREIDDKSINSQILAQEIEKSKVRAKSFENFSAISDYVSKNFDSRHIIVTMGAGDIYKVAKKII